MAIVGRSILLRKSLPSAGVASSGVRVFAGHASREDFLETLDLGIRHPSDAAEVDGAHLIQFYRFTQRLVGDADLLGGGGYAVPGTVPPALLFHFRLAHESLL